MIKRTLYFGNPAYLNTRNEQLVFNSLDKTKTTTIPIEDIGICLLDHPQITITHTLIAKLLDNNVALITCNDTHHPTGLLLPLDGNTLQSKKFQAQIAASLPLKKQLWQQTVAAKINNQAAVLHSGRISVINLQTWAKQVRSGDPDNYEAMAAVYYWKNLFSVFPSFKREREGLPPNNLLNYGYSILRAVVARALVASGLLPTLGIFHRNQYNAYCLADDIMEPYRPYVDEIVIQIVRMNGNYLEMTPTMKKQLLELPTIDVYINGEKSPLMNAVQRTTASLAKCFEGKQKTILYPVIK